MSLCEGSCPEWHSVDLACHAVLIELELAVTLLFHSLEHQPFQGQLLQLVHFQHITAIKPKAVALLSNIAGA